MKRKMPTPQTLRLRAYAQPGTLGDDDSFDDFFSFEDPSTAAPDTSPSLEQDQAALDALNASTSTPTDSLAPAAPASNDGFWNSLTSIFKGGTAVVTALKPGQSGYVAPSVLPAAAKPVVPVSPLLAKLGLTNKSALILGGLALGGVGFMLMRKKK